MKDFMGKLVWILTAIGAINWGLAALGFGLFQLPPLNAMPGLVKLVQYFVGISGIASLYMFFTQKSCCK
ncbi:DUF378 domain-containing protein [bacterium]|nr:DUF378 domain-containing protein [bacterium]